MCQYCGTKYSLEEAQKMLGAVRVDRTDELENLRILARRAVSEEDYRRAIMNYEQILKLSPYDVEAMFYQAYCNAVVSDITIEMPKLYNSIVTTFESIKGEIDEDYDVNQIAENMISALMKLCRTKVQEASLFAQTNRFVSAVAQARYKKIAACVGSLYERIEIIMEKLFPEKREWNNFVKSEYYEFVEGVGKEIYPRKDLSQLKKRLKNELNL